LPSTVDLALLRTGPPIQGPELKSPELGDAHEWATCVVDMNRMLCKTLQIPNNCNPPKPTKKHDILVQ
jgi:hypothetical protein